MNGWLDENMRSLGSGTKLLASAERMVGGSARLQKYVSKVECGVRVSVPHAFYLYLRSGYEHYKTQTCVRKRPCRYLSSDHLASRPSFFSLPRTVVDSRLRPAGITFVYDIGKTYRYTIRNLSMG